LPGPGAGRLQRKTTPTQATPGASRTEEACMSPETVTHVQSSWAKVLPIAEQAAELFYGRLFEVYPEVKPLFKGDMQAQGRKLMTMLNTAVNALTNLEAIVQPVKDMGARHARYGVGSADYGKVADALLWTLAQGLGDDFTPEVKGAWVEVYTLVADTMQAGAAEAGEAV
jgi:hemoglobin-like flavoprotein